MFLDPRTGAHNKVTPCRWYIKLPNGDRRYCEQGAHHGHFGTHNGDKPQSAFELELKHGYRESGS